MIDWINKHIKHDRDSARPRDFGIRMLLHIPIGIIMGLLDSHGGYALLFKFYERNEDAHTEDEAWKDVFGALIGWPIGRVLRYAIIIGLIVWVCRWVYNVFF